jgi:hypothetical protein
MAWNFFGGGEFKFFFNLLNKPIFFERLKRKAKTIPEPTMQTPVT